MSAYCQMQHRPIYWLLGAILTIVAVAAVGVGYDITATMTATDRANKVSTDLGVYHVEVDERDKAVVDKLGDLKQQLVVNKDDIQKQVDRRFDETGKRLDKITDAINRK